MMLSEFYDCVHEKKCVVFVIIKDSTHNLLKVKTEKKGDTRKVHGNPRQHS